MIFCQDLQTSTSGGLIQVGSAKLARQANQTKRLSMGRHWCGRVPNSARRFFCMAGFLVIAVLIIAIEHLTFASNRCRECKTSVKGHNNDVSRFSGFGQLRSMFPLNSIQLQLQDGQNNDAQNYRIFEVSSNPHLRCGDNPANLRCQRSNEVSGEEQWESVRDEKKSLQEVENQEDPDDHEQKHPTFEDESMHDPDDPDGSKNTELPWGAHSVLTELESDDKDATVKEESESTLPGPRSVWFYTRMYQHPEPEMRLLTPRIQSKTPLPDRTITIVTQTSPDRLPALERLCMTWGGALCIAVHVRLESQRTEVYNQLLEMQGRLEGHGRCWLDIQMATEDGFESDAEALSALYPVNALRNVALALATTKLVFLLDADFQLSVGLHENLTEEETYTDILTRATQEKLLFVVAAFEAAKRGQPEGAAVPETIEELKSGWENGDITYFHSKHSPSSHTPTNFTKFFDPATDSSYPISYRDGFEPYVIGARDVIPLYDPRFRGYGGNKESHLYLCAARGMGFEVIPKAFVFELPHPPSEARESYTGRNRNVDQRNRIIGLYSQFKGRVEQDRMTDDPEAFQQFLQNSKKTS